MVKKNLEQNIFRPRILRNIFQQNNFLPHKEILVKKYWVKKSFESNIFWVIKILSPTKNFVQKNWGQKYILSTKF